MRVVKHCLGTIRDAVWVGWGWIVYTWSGRTPARALQAMIRMFCRSRGRSNDLMSGIISITRPPYRLPRKDGVLGQLDDFQLAAISEELRVKGYYVFPRRLPDSVCDRLTAYALSHECEARATDAEVAAGGKPRRVVYDPVNVHSVRYEFLQQQVINIPDVQVLLSDLSIISVAQDYLRCRPIADVSGLWWHTAFGDGPDKEAAQFFHFDMDRLKWLKFFFYLTDVSADSGPHSFVAGSHRSGGIPQALLQRGYSRLEDREVASYYSSDAFIEFTAPRGTILAEDTRGLHKGKHVLAGHRLMLQLQFSNSLFGATYAPARFSAKSDPRLQEIARKFPAIYSNFMSCVDHPSA